MSKFIETICVLNGKIQNFDRHIVRVKATQEKYFGRSFQLPIQQISSLAASSTGRAKLRFTYDDAAIYDLEITPYKIRNIEKLCLVYDNSIDYSVKSADRSQLNRLYEDMLPDQEVLIVKEGYITDTSYTNVALFDGTQWVTPTTPLLHGTRRAALIAQGRITERPVLAVDLAEYEKISLINAMMDLEEVVLQISQVI